MAVTVAMVITACTPASPPAAPPARSAAPATTTTAPKPLPAQRLQVITHPEGARVVVRTADGRTVTGRTPFTREVPGGEAQLTLTRAGYEPVTRRVHLDRPRRITSWLDREGQLLRSTLRFGTGSNPKQVAYTPAGKELWTTLLGTRGMQVSSATTGKELARIPLGEHGSVEVIFNRDGSRAYVSQMETASVYEISVAERKVLRRIEVKGVWTKVLALSPDERTLYAANWVSDDVSVIDVRRWRVLRVIPTVGTPRGLYPTPDGKRLYVAGFGSGELARIDVASGRSRVLHRTGGSLRHLVGDGRRLYASDLSRSEVYVMELGTERVRKLARTDRTPNTIDLSPDGRVLFVSCRGRDNPQSYYIPGPEWGSVVVLDAASGRPLDALVTGNQTTGLDVSADGTRLAVTDFLDNRVRVYEVPAYAVLARGGGGRYGVHRGELAK